MIASSTNLAIIGVQGFIPRRALGFGFGFRSGIGYLSSRLSHFGSSPSRTTLFSARTALGSAVICSCRLSRISTAVAMAGLQSGSSRQPPFSTSNSFTNKNCSMMFILSKFSNSALGYSLQSAYEFFSSSMSISFNISCFFILDKFMKVKSSFYSLPKFEAGVEAAGPLVAAIIEPRFSVKSAE